MADSTIYVGNILTINDDELRAYFERLAPVETIYHNCSDRNKFWLLDYRFIRFSPDTDLSVFLNNQVDHTIGRIQLEIHSFDMANAQNTRLVSDRKICIAHRNPTLNRNLVKKTFARFGKIVNCNCAASTDGTQYVYIEFDSVNVVQCIFNRKSTFSVGKTPLLVQKPLRPTEIAVKSEPINRSEIQRQRLSADRAEYSSNFSNNNGQSSTAISIEQNREEELKELECQYQMIIRQDFHEISYQVDKFLSDQKRSYRRLNRFIADEIRLRRVSPLDEENHEDDCDSISSSETNSKRRKISI